MSRTNGRTDSLAIVDIYVRVSTAEQAEEGWSIQEQEDRLRKYAEAQNWAVNAVHIDGGFSGSNLQRPAIQKVISDAQNGRISKVVVYKLDRLSRSQKDTLFLIEDVFLKNGVDFVSMTESLDTSTPLGIAMIGILSVFAQLERSQIKERMMMGRDARVRTGKFHGNTNMIIGYVYEKETGTIRQDSYDAMMVRSIFKMYVDGRSESSIAKWLNDNNWRGHEWTAFKVKRTLLQPMYIGRQRWKGEEYQVEGCPNIISDELWEQSRKELARRSSVNVRPQTHGEHVTLLGGMVWCGCCGARYSAVKSNEWDKTKGAVYRYYCQSRIKRTHQFKAPPCDNIGWKDCDIHSIVLNEVRKLKSDKPITSGNDTSEASEDERALLDGIKKLDDQKARLIDLYAMGLFPADNLREKVEAVDREIAAVRLQLEEIRNPTAQLQRDEIIGVVDTFQQMVDTGDLHAQQVLLRQLIQSITITKNEVSIKWNF